MRYLWVEDFGEDSEDQEDKQSWWEEYFGISDNILVYSLEDALIYLDNSENSLNFDAVLLDIRFPVLADTSNLSIDDIYEKYYASIITRKMFSTYAESEEMQDASSGILLFLALIYRYGYSWNNIAFISANIDDEDLSAVNILKEILTKAQYGKEITAMEDAMYQTKYRDLFSANGLIADKKVELDEKLIIDEYYDGIWTQQSDFYKQQLKKLNTIQVKINESVPENNKQGLKYCSVRNQFEIIGLRMPPAFEKPNDESFDVSWLFFDWKERRNTDITNARRIIIDTCRFLEKNIEGNVRRFLKMQREYYDDESEMDEESIRMYLYDVIRNVANIPMISSEDNIRSYAMNIVASVSSPWVNIKKPKINPSLIETYYEYSCYSVMYLTRNWMAHQGIKNVDIRFAVFCFLISIRGIFDCAGMDRNKKNTFRNMEHQLINIFENNSIHYDSINIVGELSKVYSSICDDVARNAIPSGYSKNKIRVPNTNDPRALISAKGHEHSCIRECVSSQDLYRVFSLSMYYGDEKSKCLQPDRISDQEIKMILEGIYAYII